MSFFSDLSRHKGQEPVIKLWVDHVRPMPVFYNKRAGSFKEAIELLKTGQVRSISIASDLENQNKLGHELACWIERAAYNGLIPRIKWSIHHPSPSVERKIQKAMENADRFWNQNENF